MSRMIWTVTADDAAEAGRTIEDYAAELRSVLEAYGVSVEPRPDIGGPGGLLGEVDPKTGVDVRQAVARVRSAGADTLAVMNDDGRTGSR